MIINIYFNKKTNGRSSSFPQLCLLRSVLNYLWFEFDALLYILKSKPQLLIFEFKLVNL